MDIFADTFTRQAYRNKPVGAGFELLAVEGLPVGAGCDKVFNLHLLELT